MYGQDLETVVYSRDLWVQQATSRRYDQNQVQGLSAKYVHTYKELESGWVSRCQNKCACWCWCFFARWWSCGVANKAWNFMAVWASRFPEAVVRVLPHWTSVNTFQSGSQVNHRDAGEKIQLPVMLPLRWHVRHVTAFSSVKLLKFLLVLASWREPGCPCSPAAGLHCHWNWFISCVSV